MGISNMMFRPTRPTVPFSGAYKRADIQRELTDLFTTNTIPVVHTFVDRDDLYLNFVVADTNVAKAKDLLRASGHYNAFKRRNRRRAHLVMGTAYKHIPVDVLHESEWRRQQAEP